MRSDTICVGCGQTLAPDDRFCVRCGLARSSVASGVPGAEWTDAPVSTIGAPAGTEPSSPPTLATTGARSVRGGALAALVVAVIGWLTWQLFQPPTVALTAVAVPLTAVDARVPDGWSQGPPGKPLIDLDLESFVERQSLTPDGVPLPDPSESVIAEIDVELLTGLDGHWLIVSNQTHLVRLDLATGAAELHNPRGLVVGHYRGRLVTVNGAGRGIHSVSVADPEDDRVLLREGDRSEIAGLDLPGDGTLTVVLRRWPPDRRRDVEKPESLIIDLNSGETLRRIPLDVVQRTDVEFSPGYGSFEIGGDGEIRFLDDGFVEVAGNRLLLVRRCDDPATCRRYWLDRQSGRQIDRVIPANPGRYGIDRVFGPDDRIVALHDHQSTKRWYFDSITGTYLVGPANASASSRFGLGAEVVSSDGRYLIAPAEDGAIVHDLETGFSGLLAVDMPGWPIRVELVPKRNGG